MFNGNILDINIIHIYSMKLRANFILNCINDGIENDIVPTRLRQLIYTNTQRINQGCVNSSISKLLDVTKKKKNYNTWG